MPGPAYRIVTPRLVVRCWSPDDAPRLGEAVESSLDHLRPWMDWAWHEPKTLDERVLLLRDFRSRFDTGTELAAGIFDRDERRVLGSVALVARAAPGVLEIGYWLRPDAVGQGLATEAAAAMTRVAFEVEVVSRLELRCDPANARSAALARRLGFTREGTLRRNVPSVDGTGRRDSQVWGLLDDEYPSSPAARVPVEAFDALGHPLPFLRFD